MDVKANTKRHIVTLNRGHMAYLCSRLWRKD